VNNQEFKELWDFLTAGLCTTNVPQNTFDVYFEMLQGVNFEVAKAGVKLFLAETKTPGLPLPGRILETVADVLGPKVITEEEAWIELTEAIKEYGYYQKSEMLERLSPLTKKVVHSIGFKTVCHHKDQRYLRGQFRRTYTNILKQQKRDNLRNLIN
jgi:hypothetical protein